MGEQEREAEQKELADGGKRKLDPIELAKQKAQEIAARFANGTDAKRPRLGSDNSSEHSISAPPSFPVPFVSQPIQYGSQGTSKKITIPNGKVGVVIGKGGETIKMIQLQSGAKIQITKDQDADPHSLTRDVDLMGTLEQISRAEELINDVIAETDAGTSASSAVQGLNTKQSGAEQLALKVPNDKVGLLIGKGGETIKYMQSRSGARMQIIPLHLPPGDPSAERTVYINGTTEQIEAAKELVNDVISGKRIINPSGSSSYAQPVYTPAGNWAQPGQPPMQLPQYGYAQPGNQPTAASYYGNYNQQISWDQSNPAAMSQTPQQMAGYGYYGQQPQMGSAPLNPSYGYSQAPFASNSYDYSYSQQTANYSENIPSQTEQQKPYATSGYGSSTVLPQPDGPNSSQSTQAAYAYPPSTSSQSGGNPQTYWSASSFAGQPPPQTGYDQQTGYSQTAYGGLQPGQVPHTSAHATYGQTEYTHQPSEPANYVQGTQPMDYGQPQPETQSQSQPSNNSHSQSLAYGAETHDGNSNPGQGSNPTVQEAVPSQS